MYIRETLWFVVTRNQALLSQWLNPFALLKFIYSEKATKIWRNKIWRFRQILVAFSEYMIFINFKP